MSTAHKNPNAVDPSSGPGTTGHEWDGIQELNTPLPRWWLWTFYATILWAIGYWVVYPAWPLVSNYTNGLTGWHARSAVVEQIAELQKLRAVSSAKLASVPLEEIEKTPELLSLARAEGRVAFADNCAPCHGAGGAGAKGYPNLNDDDWIWGGTLEQISATITHGARSGDDAGHQGNMMPFGPMLTKAEISDTADYVLSLSGSVPKDTPAVKKGAEIFATNCSACHGEDGKGNQELGARNLTSGIWLYGGDKATIVQTITNGRGGVMPAWSGRLPDTTIKALTVYVHTLGGGQ
ncbi:Cbb3-type cytochrome c oxidase subunit FixP [Azorhizobium oxalatiphilum]|uniref:Cbb3-type cytochrome c oxidase subunit n=1 Tax=Azorhizobium oxalatiphilum TaxID=980631 RepID=A0A917FI36_9HYPH|nr:cytochrome-c oxidase, cbb3-type subunit III [Azorhizobium oxalatiphilum]GGF81071.1 Cbb3-type cytochrome c oxidase subunit FixP [Azorhizobium oxalatiphilum]